MHDSILYFAYGSNLHPIRLTKRVHEVEFVGIAELRSHALRFHKRSIDNSAKCDAFFTGAESDCVIGALYRIPPSISLIWIPLRVADPDMSANHGWFFAKGQKLTHSPTLRSPHTSTRL